LAEAHILRTERGVTLIELMVVTAIVAILAAIAYPSYQSQVRKSRRAAAQAFLMDIASRQQQRMLDVRSYSEDLAALNVSLPEDLTGFYTVAISAEEAPLRFTLTATAVNGQAKDGSCTPMTLTNTGAKAPAVCW
jgi:type IV pilus assembly protein PilE